MSAEHRINTPESSFNTEWRIAVLERIVDRLIQACPSETVTVWDIERWRRDALEDLRLKYAGVNVTLAERSGSSSNFEHR
jgi:hypothetical protein